MKNNLSSSGSSERKEFISNQMVWESQLDFCNRALKETEETGRMVKITYFNTGSPDIQIHIRSGEYSSGEELKQKLDTLSMEAEVKRRESPYYKKIEEKEKQKELKEKEKWEKILTSLTKEFSEIDFSNYYQVLNWLYRFGKNGSYADSPESLKKEIVGKFQEKWLFPMVDDDEYIWDSFECLNNHMDDYYDSNNPEQYAKNIIIFSLNCLHVSSNIDFHNQVFSRIEYWNKEFGWIRGKTKEVKRRVEEVLSSVVMDVLS